MLLLNEKIFIPFFLYEIIKKMVYELPPTGTQENRTTTTSPLEGVAAKPLSQAESMILTMDYVSRTASLNRQRGCDYDGNPMVPSVTEIVPRPVRELELASA